MFFLWIKGYIILKHRFKYNDILGDIDIIAVSRKFIVFIEVKSSKKKINQEKVLNDPQINRMIEISDYFLLKNEKFRNFKKRYDYIEIKRFLYVFFTIKHYKNFIS
jgi:Holliday junction resolvase-like predicted endonuclease